MSVQQPLADGPFKTRSPASDPLVPWLVVLGGLVLFVGWVVGVVLLWLSDAWPYRDKLLGTFVLPGGLLGSVILLTRATQVSNCSNSGGPGVATVTHCTMNGFSLPPYLGIPLLLALLAAPVLTGLHLERVRRATLT
jgi:hypothetical protein